MARLDRAPRLREVAQLGSVLGREIAYGPRALDWSETTGQIGRNELRGEAILHRLRPDAAEIDVEVARNPHEIAHVHFSRSPALAEPHRGL